VIVRQITTDVLTGSDMCILRASQCYNIMSEYNGNYYFCVVFVDGRRMPLLAAFSYAEVTRSKAHGPVITAVRWSSKIFVSSIRYTCCLRAHALRFVPPLISQIVPKNKAHPEHSIYIYIYTLMIPGT